jgi:hypothetical protein
MIMIAPGELRDGILSGLRWDAIVLEAEIEFQQKNL